MEDFLVILIQFIVEFVFNVLANLPFDWPSRNRDAPEPDNMTGIYILWLVFGGSLAAISLVVVSRTFIAWPAEYSEPCRPPIPIDAGHPFRYMPAGYSD